MDPKLKKLVFILLCLVLVAETSARDSIKAIGGFNLSKYSETLRSNSINKFRTGFEIGIGYEINLSSHIALEVDGLFCQKGSREEVRDLDGSYMFTFNYVLNEISVPILMKVRLKTGSSPYILVGGELSFIISHNFKIEEEGWGTIWMLPETKWAYYGIVFGCGFEWKKNRISPIIEARYYLGLTNIFKSYPSGTPLVKPRTIVFLVGLKYQVF